jgi:hypothetical protein
MPDQCQLIDLQMPVKIYDFVTIEKLEVYRCWLIDEETGVIAV